MFRRIQRLKYKNFFVTLVLDKNKNLKSLKKFKYKINILKTKNINMSEKRNLAAKKYVSNYLAFIDSDASPCKDWLNKAVKDIKLKALKVIGGPNLPFRNQSFWEKITYYCKRSFFVTAHYNFLNFRSKNRYCKFLHSSNFIINRDLYNSVNGMNKNLYIGEDHDLFFRLSEKFNKIKIYFSKDIYVYHEDREFKFFLMQRFCYGLNVLTSKNTRIKRSLALIPFFVFSSIFIVLFFKPNLFSIIFLLFSIVLVLIFFEVRKYVNKFFIRILTTFCIILSNFFYGIGTFFYFLGLRKIIEKKIYRNIKRKFKI